MVKELENIDAKLNWHWRDTMRTIRFFHFDARVAFLVPMWLLYLRISTIIISFVVFYIFHFLENRGLTFPSAIRAFRTWLIGRSRPSVTGLSKRKFIDYG